MLFNSVDFLIFFPTVVLLFFLVPKRLQWVILLIASAYFYMAFVPWYILILVFLILSDFTLGKLIEKNEGAMRRSLLVFSIIANIGTLFVFKYFNFFNANIASLAAWLDWNYSIESFKFILPIGLSFHVFQSLSYVIEVYRGKYPAERHLGVYALYVLFFPQLVAGPIERPQNLLPQFHLEKSFDWGRAKDGLTLMLWGFFKKLVIADQVGLVVDQVYGNLHHMPPAAMLIAAVLFSYQIYCDFSGYSDIAIGAARVLGFDLMKNFDRPYASRSIAEFWRRWHISLSSWIRDYVYIPLGGNRVSLTRHSFNLFLTFLLCGLWHGANWTFVVWGGLHGSYLIFGNALKKAGVTAAEESRIGRFSSVFLTFVLVTVTWVFFRLPTFADAWYVLRNLPLGVVQLLDLTYMKNAVLIAPVIGTGAIFLLFRLVAIAFMENVEYFAAKYGSLRILLSHFPFWVRLSSYYFILIWIFLLGNIAARSFIYFQF